MRIALALAGLALASVVAATDPSKGRAKFRGGPASVEAPLVFDPS